MRNFLPFHWPVHLLRNCLALESVDEPGPGRFRELSQDRSSSRGRGLQCLFFACLHAFNDEVTAVVFDALALAPTFAAFEEHEHEGIHCHGRHDEDFSFVLDLCCMYGRSTT